MEADPVVKPETQTSQRAQIVFVVFCCQVAEAMMDHAAAGLSARGQTLIRSNLQLERVPSSPSFGNRRHLPAKTKFG